MYEQGGHRGSKPPELALHLLRWMAFFVVITMFSSRQLGNRCFEQHLHKYVIPKLNLGHRNARISLYTPAALR